MAFRPRRTALLVSPLAFCFAFSSCALDASERRTPRRDWPGPYEMESYAEQPDLPAGVFEVECRFGITGCEAEASARCGYAGFHVVGSYRTQTALGWPYYYMRAACGPAPSGANAYQAAPGAREKPSVPPREIDRRGRVLAARAFEVECRFGISGCERQVLERCGAAGYHVLGSYKTQGAFGSPYFYMKAACGPEPKANPWTSVAGPSGESPAAEPSTGTAAISTEGTSAAWDVAGLEMPPASASPTSGENKAARDPFDKLGASDAEAVAALTSLAKSGNVEAQTRLAARYATGEGVAKSSAKAVEWYRRAAEQGDAAAQNNLAVFYERGESVPRDVAEAARLYRKAAEQGAAIAQYNLAVLCRVGLGVPKDGEQAAGWAKKAAIQGQANAQALLGALYARGEGVPRDDVLAYGWFNLAASQGLEPAAKARDEMVLPPQILREAQRLSSAWKTGDLLQHETAQKKGRAPSRR